MESHLPIGLMSKKCTEVRRMALNMLLWRVWAELTRTLKKIRLRTKPNTTEVAVKADKSTQKNSMSTLQSYPRACSVISYAFQVTLLSWTHKKHTLIFFSSFVCVWFFFLLLECWFTTVSTKPERVKKLGVTRRQSKQSNSREQESTAISLYSWGPCTRTLGLEGLGPQPKNCGSVHWMAAVFRDSAVHKKAMCAQWASPA